MKPLIKGARGVILKSVYGHEIEDVRIMGGENYLVAKTPETLLVGDLQVDHILHNVYKSGQK